MLVHSGQMDPDERDPTNLFAAVARLKEAGRIGPSDLKIVLRATGHDATHAKKIQDFRIGDTVSLEPLVPHRQALQELFDADGLLILQGPACNRQIPAKLYEAFRTGRPLFVIADPNGDTANAVRETHVHGVVRHDSVDEIAERLCAFLTEILKDRAAGQPLATLKRYSRETRTAELAALFDSVVGQR
jgi:hypothetical protein